MMVTAIHHGECESQAEPEREDERLHPVRFSQRWTFTEATVTSALRQARQSEFHAPRRRRLAQERELTEINICA
jgi:hypothetical protein